MTGHDVLSDLQRGGYTLWIDGDRLKCRGTISPITDDLLGALRDNKQELIVLLKAGQPRPYFDMRGGLVIPFSSDPIYHWWNGGQSVSETCEQIRPPK